MDQYLEAFLIGNGAILGNVCMLPLYPGLIAFLAGRADGERGRRPERWLGVLVLAGVLSLMVVAGLALFLVRRSVSAVLPVVLPVVYVAVLALGALMLAGRKPLARLGTAQAPVLRSPYATAYVYGLLLGPMTLPCAGPLVVSAFVLGVAGGAELAEGLLYFLAFGLGFGWPLVVLPLVASAAARRWTIWIARREAIVARVSGALLVGVAILGIAADVLPGLLQG